MQNHRQDPITGRKNTNLNVFEKLNVTLAQEDVTLSVLRFWRVGDRRHAGRVDAYAQDRVLVHLVEELLICTYRHAEQCGWNRT